MWALVITALAAIFVAVTTYMELMGARQLAQIQDELIQAKDKQLGLDLKDKDSKIADAQKSASEANQRATEATLASERERGARLALERQVTPRRLTGEQKAILVKLLKSQVGGVTIVSSAFDGIQRSALGNSPNRKPQGSGGIYWYGGRK